MSAFFVFAFFLLFFVILKVLHLNCSPTLPRLVCCDTKFLGVILKKCPHLLEPFVPVKLWGMSGHIQTIIHSTVGRTYCPDINAKRLAAKQEDGSTVTWDLYEPTACSQFEDIHTLAICPGIANSSESVYVRSLVSLASAQGFRCIVLNHLGVLSSVKLTSSKIFRYGKTDEFHVMLEQYLETYPDTKVILVGFSMGGNIICKYLGENGKLPDNILGAISICQGYDAVKCIRHLLQWTNLARLYLFTMTENMRSVILRHKEVLLTDEVKHKYNIDERKVLSAATLPELDDVYTRLIYGYLSVEEMYKADSSSIYLHNIVVPIVFMNAKDDPLIPYEVLCIPEKFAGSHKKSLYIETEHGGHLGYYNGGILFPNAITWLDYTVVSLAAGLSQM